MLYVYRVSSSSLVMFSEEICRGIIVMQEYDLDLHVKLSGGYIIVKTDDQRRLHCSQDKLLDKRIL